MPPSIDFLFECWIQYVSKKTVFQQAQEVTLGCVSYWKRYGYGMVWTVLCRKETIRVKLRKS